jgi:hypothetical protein
MRFLARLAVALASCPALAQVLPVGAAVGLAILAELLARHGAVANRLPIAAPFGAERAPVVATLGAEIA